MRITCFVAGLLFGVLIAFNSSIASSEADEADIAYNDKNFAKAAELYRICADRGEAVCQSKLGLMYDNGQGVPQYHQEAARWYRLAADRGDVIAQVNLGLMYAVGRGVPKNLTEAYAWWAVAAATGNEPAKRNMDAASRNMTSTQVEDAQTLAKEYRAKMKR